MKLKIADHAVLEIPKELVPAPVVNIPQEAKVKSLFRRSLGLLSATSLIGIPSFLALGETMLASGSSFVLAGGVVAMGIGLGKKHTMQDFFPKRSQSKGYIYGVKEPQYFTPYKNWDNAFLPYAGEVVDLGYRHQRDLQNGAILGSGKMTSFQNWMSISDEAERKRVKKNLYGEISDYSHFWSAGQCPQAVRFHIESV